MQFQAGRALASDTDTVDSKAVDTGAVDCEVKTGSARAGSCDLCDVRERSICIDLDPRAMQKVERTMARRAVAKNRAILSEGEPNDSLYIVLRGSFRLSKLLEDGRRQVTGFIFQGDFLGVRHTEQSAYTAEALEDSLVCCFPHRFLDEAAETSPGVKDRLIAKGQTEYHKAQDHIVLLGKKTAEERVASFMKTLAEAVGRERGGGYVEAPFAMSRQDIADYLGLRLETLSRTLSALKKKGFIDSINRKSVILKLEL